MAIAGGHGECPGCQLCIEYMLEAQYGPEWWNHPDNQPHPEEPERDVEALEQLLADRGRLRLVEGEPPE